MKQCLECKQEKHEQFFWKNKRTSDGLDRYCIECGKIRRKKDYYLKKDKYISRMKEYQQRPEYKEQHKQYQKKWLQTGGEQWIKEYHKEYNKLHKEEKLEISQNWYRKHPERQTEIRRKYRTINSGKVLSWIAKRRAQEKQAIPGWFEKEKIEELYKLCRHKTNKNGIIYHVDHIIPINSKDVCGLHCLDNLQILTAEENLVKSNKLLEFKEINRVDN